MLGESGWTRGEAHHLLWTPCPREAWHPLPRLPGEGGDGQASVQSSKAHSPNLQLLPAGTSPPLRRRAHGCREFPPGLRIQAFLDLYASKQTPSWDVSCRGRLSNSSQKKNSAIEPQGWM